MRIAILGTGLIGASIGLAIRSRMTDVHVVGYDRDRGHATEAQRRGAVDEVARTPSDAVRGAGLVVFAVPILAIKPLMEEVKDDIGPDAVVTDTGSSKAEIMRWARQILPGHAGVVAGHPMAGKTEFGPAAAEATLFEGARWVIVPSVHASEAAINTVTNIATALGATPMVMDADEHDAYVAAVSHLPMMAATALFSMNRASEAWPELSLLAAGGFRDATRLAATDPNMAYDIAITNRQNIAHWIDRYVSTLLELRRRLLDTEAEDDFFRLLAATELEYVRFREGKVGREEIGERPPEVDPVGTFQDMLAGGWVRERYEQMLKDSEDRLSKRDEDDRSQRRV